MVGHLLDYSLAYLVAGRRTVHLITPASEQPKEWSVNMSATSRAEIIDTRTLMRAGVLVLPLGAALKLVGNLGTFNSVGYGVPQSTEAAVVTKPAFILGELVGSTIPVLLAPFGVLALFAYLMPSGQRRTLAAALICSLLGAGATLPALGVINFAIPALGDAYQNGQSGAMNIADSFFVWPRGALLYPAVLFPVGTILFVVVMWRSRMLPRSVALLFAASTILIAVPVPLHPVRLAGGVLGLIAGAWIAGVIRRQLRPTGVTATPSRPAVVDSGSASAVSSPARLR